MRAPWSACQVAAADAEVAHVSEQQSVIPDLISRALRHKVRASINSGCSIATIQLDTVGLLVAFIPEEAPMQARFPTKVRCSLSDMPLSLAARRNHSRRHKVLFAPLAASGSGLRPCSIPLRRSRRDVPRPRHRSMAQRARTDMASPGGLDLHRDVDHTNE